MNPFALSEAAKAVLWLWENDARNWYIGTHAVVHEPTGVGIWTANECYGLSLYFDIPNSSRRSGHATNGHQVKLKWRDRKALYRAMQMDRFARCEITRQVSDWASSHIRHDVPDSNVRRRAFSCTGQ